MALPAYAVALEGGAPLYADAEDAEALALLPEGEALEVTGVEDGWIAVSWDGRTAWIPAECAVLTDELPVIAEGEPEPEVEMGSEVEETVGEADEGDGSGLTIDEEEAGEEIPEEEIPEETVDGEIDG